MSCNPPPWLDRTDCSKVPSIHYISYTGSHGLNLLHSQAVKGDMWDMGVIELIYRRTTTHTHIGSHLQTINPRWRTSDRGHNSTTVWAGNQVLDLIIKHFIHRWTPDRQHDARHHAVAGFLSPLFKQLWWCNKSIIEPTTTPVKQSFPVFVCSRPPCRVQSWRVRESA